MACNQLERTLCQHFAGWNFVPGRRAGWMRQRNQIEAVARMHDAKFAANYVLQFCAVDELHDGQSADWNDEMRSQDSDLTVHPRRAVANLIRPRNTICAAGILPGETAADCSEINF